MQHNTAPRGRFQPVPFRHRHPRQRVDDPAPVADAALDPEEQDALGRDGQVGLFLPGDARPEGLLGAVLVEDGLDVGAVQVHGHGGLGAGFQTQPAAVPVAVDVRSGQDGADEILQQQMFHLFRLQPVVCHQLARSGVKVQLHLGVKLGSLDDRPVHIQLGIGVDRVVHPQFLHVVVLVRAREGGVQAVDHVDHGAVLPFQLLHEVEGVRHGGLGVAVVGEHEAGSHRDAAVDGFADDHPGVLQLHLFADAVEHLLVAALDAELDALAPRLLHPRQQVAVAHHGVHPGLTAPGQGHLALDAQLHEPLHPLAEDGEGVVDVEDFPGTTAAVGDHEGLQKDVLNVPDAVFPAGHTGGGAVDTPAGTATAGIDGGTEGLVRLRDVVSVDDGDQVQILQVPAGLSVLVLFVLVQVDEAVDVGEFDELLLRPDGLHQLQAVLLPVPHGDEVHVALAHTIGGVQGGMGAAEDDGDTRKAALEVFAHIEGGVHVLRIHREPDEQGVKPLDDLVDVLGAVVFDAQVDDLHIIAVEAEDVGDGHEPQGRHIVVPCQLPVVAVGFDEVHDTFHKNSSYLRLRYSRRLPSSCGRLSWMPGRW